MIQILGIREFEDKETKKQKKAMCFFNKKWRVPSVPALFANIETVLENIPAGEHYDLHYTLAQCKEEPGKIMLRQEVLPIDVDDIDVSKRDEYVPIILEAFKLDPEKTGIVFSGGGLHFLVELNQPVYDPGFFKQKLDVYKSYARAAEAQLVLKKLPGKVDTAVFREKATLRLPGTMNTKYNVKAEIINRNISPQEFDWKGTETLTSNLKNSEIKRYPTPDEEAVVTGCEFLKSIANRKDKIPEPEWYAALSIVGRLNNPELPHTVFSKNSENWSREETEQKVEQAVLASGPRTCTNINDVWGKCNTCPHWGTGLASPILLKSKNHIATEDIGFRRVVYDSTGRPKPGEPVYDDLRKAFERDHFYCVMDDTKEVYIFNGTHWENFSTARIEGYAQKRIAQPVKNTHIAEFTGLIKRTNLRNRSMFNESTAYMMNLQNGILDVKNNKLYPHSQTHGFRSVLEYNYNPDATAPMFKRFMQDITCGDEALERVMLEFMGFVISNHDCDPPYAMFLVGEGSNGKSTFIEIMREIVGRDNCSALTLKDLQSETMRDMLDGKLANFSEETPKFSMIDNSIFKTLTDGGDATARKLYHPAYVLKNRAKFIFACNELPKSFDPTLGMFRRLLIIPFNATFEGDKIDRGLKKKIIAQELSGVLNMCLNAYSRFLEKGFTSSKTVLEAVEEYRAEVDSTVNWIKDNFHDIIETEWDYPVTPEKISPRKCGFVTLKQLYEMYTDDCRETNIRAAEFKHFCKRVHSKMETHMVHGSRRIQRLRLGEQRLRAILGSRLGKGLQVLTKDTKSKTDIDLKWELDAEK